MESPVDPPQLLVRWEALVGQMLDRTSLFPKSVRYTFGWRIDNLPLDVLEKPGRASPVG